MTCCTGILKSQHICANIPTLNERSLKSEWTFELSANAISDMHMQCLWTCVRRDVGLWGYFVRCPHTILMESEKSCLSYAAHLCIQKDKNPHMLQFICPQCLTVCILSLQDKLKEQNKTPYKRWVVACRVAHLHAGSRYTTQRHVSGSTTASTWLVEYF